MFFRRKRRSEAQRSERQRSEPAGAEYVVLEGDWTRDIWDRRPIRIPAVLDVDTFLDQNPMPSIWPDDEDFNAYAGESDGDMRRLWVMVLLNHPEPEIVAACLRSPYIENISGHSVTVADLLIDSAVADVAAETVWRLDDDGVHIVLNAVLSRGIVPGGHSRRQADRAVDLLRSTCPPERRAFLEADIRGEELGGTDLGESAAADHGQDAQEQPDHEQTAETLSLLAAAAQLDYGGLSEDQLERWHDERYLDGLVHGGAAPEGLGNRVKIRAIGHRLNDEGGLALMQAVAQRAGDLSGGRMAERMLNHHWNLIGDWMS